MYKYIYLTAFLFSGFLAAAQADWTLKMNKDSIQVFNRKEETSRFNELKVETYLAGKPSDLIAVLMDVDNHRQWAYGTKSSYVLKKQSDSDIYFYKEIKSPPTVTNRDLVARMKYSQNPKTNVITVQVTSVADYIPAKSNLVRVPISNETWYIKPINNHLVKVEYYLQIDPGGSLSPVLVNLFATKGPYESFRNLREQMAVKNVAKKISYARD